MFFWQNEQKSWGFLKHSAHPAPNNKELRHNLWSEIQPRKLLSGRIRRKLLKAELRLLRSKTPIDQILYFTDSCIFKTPTPDSFACKHKQKIRDSRLLSIWSNFVRLDRAHCSLNKILFRPTKPTSKTERAHSEHFARHLPGRYMPLTAACPVAD